MPKKNTAAAATEQVTAALKRHYGGGDATTILFEVAASTGWNANRHLDAVAMELWPSRGLCLHGIEIKVSQADFRREAKDPAKAEEVARFLDYFWVATPQGLLERAELPSAWGLLERVNGGKIQECKPAVKTEAQPITRGFLAALLRAAARDVTKSESELAIETAIEARSATLQEGFDKRVEAAADRLRAWDREAADKWRQLIAIVAPESEGLYLSSSEILDAVRFVRRTRLVENYGPVFQLADALERAQRELGEAIEAIGIERPPAADLLQHARRAKHS